jgi:hypothetical protein
MLSTFIVAIALAFVLPHGHAAAPAVTAHAHVTAFDTSGGGPPTHQCPPAH